MNTKIKYAAAAALAGVLALAAANPADARWRGGGAAAVAGGFIAGAAIGAAVAGGPYYYGPGYYDSGYYGPYAYDYGYDSYAYEPAYTYAPGPYYGGPYYRSYRPSGYGGCLASPGSQSSTPC